MYINEIELDGKIVLFWKIVLTGKKQVHVNGRPLKNISSVMENKSIVMRKMCVEPIRM